VLAMKRARSARGSVVVVVVMAGISYTPLSHF
jgi:hypothetical protein